MPEHEQAKRRFRFSIRSLLAAMFVIGLTLAFWRFNPTLFWITLTGGIAANVLGAVVALFVTHVLRFPTDGSLRCESEATEPSDG